MGPWPPRLKGTRQVSEESAAFGLESDPATIASDGDFNQRLIDARAAIRMGAPTVSVVIPALNEAENLQHVLPKVPAWVYEEISSMTTARMTPRRQSGTSS